MQAMAILQDRAKDPLALGSCMRVRGLATCAFDTFDS